MSLQAQMNAVVQRLQRHWPRRSGPAARIVVGADAIYAVVGTAEAARTARTADVPLEQTLEQAAGALNGQPCDVEFDGSSALTVAVEWNPVLTGHARWQALAESRLQQRTAVDEGRPLRVRYAPAMPPEARFAAAVDEELLQKVLATLGRRVRSVRIGLADRLNGLLAARPRFSGCAVQVTPQATAAVVWIAVLQAGAIVRVRRRRLSSGDEAGFGGVLLAALTTEWAACGAGVLPAVAVDPVAAPALAAAAVPLAELPAILPLPPARARGPLDIDLRRRGWPRPFATWALCAAGLLALTLAAMALQSTWQERAAVAASIERLQAALAAEMPARSLARANGSTPGSAPVSSRSATDADAQRVVVDLNRPWSALFEAFESVQRPSVRVQQVDVDAKFSQIRMHLEGKSLQQVLDYADQLAAQHPVRSLQLVQHEWKTVAGTRVVSARLTGTLDAASVHAAAGSSRLPSPMAELRSERESR